MTSMKLLALVVLIFAFTFSQGTCQKSGHTQKQKSAKSAGAQSVDKAPADAHQHPDQLHARSVPVQHQQQQQGAVHNQPPPRFCRCDELEQCYHDQTAQQNDLTSRCRHECGLAFLTNDTAEYVANCYDAYEKSKRSQKTNKRDCVDNLTSKQCLTGDEHQKPPTQTTLTVDPTKIVEKRVRRNYKTLLPQNVNMYASCVKTCRKNQGIVNFNVDGTIAKPTRNQANREPAVDGTKIPTNAAVEKRGKGYLLCAQHLGCQLVPTDKRLEKQAKEICKYQVADTRDHELTLCTCLEAAFNQNFQCEPMSINANTCSSSSSQSSESASCEHTKTATNAHATK